MAHKKKAHSKKEHLEEKHDKKALHMDKKKHHKK